MEKSRLMSLYKNVNLMDRVHMRVRYDRCPFEFIEVFVPKEGRILDLGCGHGLFTNIMAFKSGERQVTGLDPSSQKINVAMSSTEHFRNVMFICGKLDMLGPINFRAVTIIDVLYLLSPENQVALLKKIFHRLEGRGVLVIKEVPATNDIRFKIAYFNELLMVRVLKRTLGEQFAYRTEDEWVSLLNKIGYQVQTTRLKTCAPSTLFVCKRS